MTTVHEYLEEKLAPHEALLVEFSDVDEMPVGKEALKRMAKALCRLSKAVQQAADAYGESP